MSTPFHIPVLKTETMAALAIQPEGTYLDATFGCGGHSQALLSRLSKGGRLYALDRDAEAVVRGRSIMDPRFFILQSPFSQFPNALATRGWPTQFDGILLDLGVSSPQLDQAERGFSFQEDGPLDMRMDPSCGIPVKEWLKTVSLASLTEVLRTYGEERFARRIATRILERMAVEPLTRTAELAALVERALPFRERHKHPATRTFQALRLYINQELEELRQVLPLAVNHLKPNGVLAIISFHSLEDRIVKQFMRQASKTYDTSDPSIPLSAMESSCAPKLKLAPKCRPSREEIMKNPRARSAILRSARRVK